MTILGAGTIYALNRYVSGEGASIVFLALILIVAVIADTPEQVAEGRGLLIFAIPIVTSSVLLRPWASLVVASVSGLIVSTLSMVVLQKGLPNAPAIAAFFMLALGAWFSASSLENAMKRLTASHRLLEKSERTLRSYFDDAPVGMIVADEQGHCLDINRASERMLGRSAHRDAGNAHD